MKKFLKIFFNLKNNYTFVEVMIQINKSTINLNFDTQFDKNGRPFRLSGTKSELFGEVTHIFRRLDAPADFFYIKVDRFGKFLEFIE